MKRYVAAPKGFLRVEPVLASVGFLASLEKDDPENRPPEVRQQMCGRDYSNEVLKSFLQKQK